MVSCGQWSLWVVSLLSMAIRPPCGAIKHQPIDQQNRNISEIRQIPELISSPSQRCTMQKPPLIELRRNCVFKINIHLKINSMDIVKVSSWDNLPEKKEFRNNSILRRRQLRGKEYMLRIINLRFQGIEYCGKGVLPCSTLIYTDKPWTGLKCDYEYELFNFCDFSRVQNYGTPIK